MIKLFISALVCTGIAAGLLLDTSATVFSRVLFSIGAGILLSNLILAIIESTATAKFTTWLRQHRERLPSNWKGSQIAPETELVQFVFIASFVIPTAELRSRYYISAQRRPFTLALLYSIMTFISGWWSVLGVVYTPLALFKNLTFAYRTTVRELVTKIDLEDKREPGAAPGSS